MYTSLRPHPEERNTFLAPRFMHRPKAFRRLPALRTRWIVLATAGLTLALLAILLPTLLTRRKAQQSSASAAALAECSPPVCETGIIFPTIKPESFSPFPVPSDTPIPNVFVEALPNNPPPASDTGKVIPDFGAAWKAAHGKARARIAGWTLEQKVGLTTGVGWANGLCVGNIPPVADFQGLCLEVRGLVLLVIRAGGLNLFVSRKDSPLGVRFVDFATAFPTGVNTAAT